MIYTKDCPKGIDVWITRLQKELYDYVLEVWSLRDQDYNCYGRAYQNRRESGYVPELFNGIDYKELMLDDTVAVTSFFGVNTPIVSNNYKSQTANVHLVLFVNLERVKPDIKRGDVEARLDVYNLLKLEQHGFVMKNEVLTVPKALEEYTAITRLDWLKDTNVMKFDMNPWHTFRFNMTCTYDPVTE